VADRVRQSAGLLDLDFWLDSRARQERASVYGGTAKLMDVHAGSGGRLRLEVTGLVRRRLSLAQTRSAWVEPEEYAGVLAEMTTLIDRALPVLPKSHTQAGRLLRDAHLGPVIGRGFAPRFDDDARGGLWIADLAGRIGAALNGVPGIPPNLPPKTVCDALVIGERGDSLLVDLEAPRSAEIGFAASRAVQNLALWDAWVTVDSEALAQVRTMARLREALGLCPPGTSDRIAGATTSSFVLVTETGVSDALVTRLERAAAALVAAGLLDQTRFAFHRV
jgi:hypothetical protein